MPAHEEMIVRFRFPESPDPFHLFFHVLDQPGVERKVDLARMKGFAQRSHAFLEELQQESDRGALIVASDYLAGLLKELFHERMRPLPGESEKELFEDQGGALKNLACRIKLAYALGWIGEDMLADLNGIRKMRNDFAAHSHQQMRFTDRGTKDRCATFKALKFFSGSALSPRTQFFFTVIMLSLQLNHLQAISQQATPGFDPQIAEVVNPDGM